MALYKTDSYLLQTEDGAFDVAHHPGQAPPHSGIYRCMGCGREVVAEQARALPPQNHHQHAPAGYISWLGCS